MTDPSNMHSEPTAQSDLIIAERDGEINLLDLFVTFFLQWPLLLALSLLFMVFGVYRVYSIKPLYQASSSILPQGRDDTSNIASYFSGRSQSDVFVGLLTSRSVGEDMIDKLNLMELYHTNSRETALATLRANSIFAAGRDTIILIQVRDSDATAAMRIANAYLDALQQLREKMILRGSTARNHFFDEQLLAEANALAQAEENLQQVSEKTGVVLPDAQTNIGLSAIAQSRAEIKDLDVKLAGLLQGESEQNPEVRALRAQINQLQSQVGSMESAANSNGTGAAASARQMPGLNLEFSRRQRDVKLHEARYTSIANEYQSTRLSEAFTEAPFVVVDRAEVPESRVYPNRKLLLEITAALSFMGAFLCVGLRLLWRRMRDNPANNAKFALMRNSFRFSR